MIGSPGNRLINSPSCSIRPASIGRINVPRTVADVHCCPVTVNNPAAFHPRAISD